MAKMAKNTAIPGTKWKRDPKRTGRACWGMAPNNFRGWQLEDKEGHAIAFLHHTRDIHVNMEPKVLPEPAWKIRLRFQSTPEEAEKHGALVDFTLKVRYPAPNGDEDMEVVEKAMMEASEAWLRMKAKRDGVQEPSFFSRWEKVIKEGK